MSTDTLSYVLSCLRRSSENAYSWSLTPNEAGLLVAEIERLRDQRRLDNAEAARIYDFARDKGKALERDVVAAYLAKCVLLGAAEGVREGDHYIERGEHRPEEKA